MLTNRSFCPMPWTGLMYNFDGKIKNCIRSEDHMPIGSICSQPAHQVVIGEENVKRQQAILDQQPVKSCQPCYDLERGKTSFNIISDRVFYIRELKTVPLDTYTVGNFDLQTVDVRWSNLCNFACVYCGPEFSSKWAAELKISSQTPDHTQLSQFKDYILTNAHKLKHVYLAGGEPLLMKENLELLEKLNPEIQLRVNTNLSKVDTKVFDTICSFKNVHWTISVETVAQEFEYIRHGGHWAEFLDNLSRLQKLDHKISFNMLHFLLNYNSLFDCVDFLKQQGFHNNSFIIGALIRPDYLNIRHLPDLVLQSVEQKLKDRINQNPGYLLEDSYRNLLHYVQQPFEKDINNSFEKLSELDKRRNLDSSAIFKDLYKLR